MVPRYELLKNVRGPTGDARKDEDRREHRRRDAEEMVGGGAEEIEIGKEILLTFHYGLDALRDGVEMRLRMAGWGGGLRSRTVVLVPRSA